MTTAEITREEILAVYPKIAQIMADALGCDVEQVGLGVPLIEGLIAESIDFLDIIFGLERTFKVKIRRNKIVENARGDLPEAAFEEKGYLTAVGLKRLREYLSEVPADRFRSPMMVVDIPRLFTAETFCKIVARELRAGPGDPSRAQGLEGTRAPKADA
jgi:acyl carrier protein